MNLKETEQLLREMSAIDGRVVTAERIKAWQSILENLPMDIAQEALVMARRDDKIQYLEPKHLIAKAKEWAEQSDVQARREAAMNPTKQEFKGIPAPNCKHKSTIAICNICSREMWKFHSRHEHLDYGDKLCIDFARGNLYS